MGMQIDLTLFVAADPDLDACFPGWRQPLSAPRTIEVLNPYSKEMNTFLTWDPARLPGASPPRSLGDARRRKALDPILSPENEADRWRQDHRVPALLRTFPHFAMAGLSMRCPGELLDVLGLPSSPPGRSFNGDVFKGREGPPPARFIDCPEGEGSIETLPDGVVGPLSELGDVMRTKKCLVAWQKALDLKGKSAKLIESEAAEGSDWSLRRIHALAIEAVRRGGHLYIHQADN